MAASTVERECELIGYDVSETHHKLALEFLQALREIDQNGHVTVFVVKGKPHRLIREISKLLE